jgi:ABC-type transport system substrate-binding protein
MVAAATLEARDADMWLGVSAVPNIIDLKEKDYKINWELGMSNCIILNSNDPKSIFANKKVREAIEYAIDRPAIAKMLGQGLYEPLFQLASAKSPTYVEGYNPRPYNPEKAKKLLAEAGYDKGFKTTMLALPTSASIDAVSALRSYLGNVGIDVRADVADFGRYFGSVFGTGFKDMALSVYGNHPDGKEIFVHFGPNPATFRTGDIYKSPKFLSLCNEALSHKYMNAAEAKEKIKEAIREAGEDAIAVPLWKTVNTAIMHPYVHSDYYTIHTIIWTPYDDFMEKH